MAFTKIVSPGIDTTGSYTVQELNTVGVMTAGTVQVGSATTVHSTGIDLGSGNITSHNINSTGIITATSFVGPVSATNGTFSGNVSIGGTLTYEDVTNVDSVGLITARAGINATGDITFGANSKAKLFENGTQSGVQATNSTSSAHLMTHDGNEDIHVDPSGHIKFEVAGTEKLRITSDGDVGIGTTNPSTKLHLSSGSATQLTISNTSNSMSDGATMGTIDFAAGLSNTINARVGGLVEGTSEAGGDLVFETRTDGGSLGERLRIDSAGAILVGEISSSQGRFSFHNSGSSGGDAASTNNMGLSVRNDAGPSIVDLTGIDNFTARIHNGAYAGSGVSNPQGTITKLLFHGVTHNGWNAHSAICMDVQGTNGGKGDLVFLTGGNGSDLNERLRITSAGNISIGGVSPSASALTVKMDTNKHIGFNPSQGEVDNVPAIVAFQDNGSLQDMGFRGVTLRFATGNAERLRITNDGRVGLGTITPGNYDAEADDFVVAGSDHTGITIASTGTNKRTNLYFADGTSGDARYRGAFTYDHNDDSMMVRTAGSERFRITNTGRMGVGTNDPNALLEVRDSENTTQGDAQIRISKGVGAAAAPATISRANTYLHLGGTEWGSGANGKYLIGLGYTNDEVGTGIPAYMGFTETSVSGYTQGDLIFGTRGNTTGTDNPTERLRITSSGILKINPAELQTTAGDKFANIKGGGVLNTKRFATGHFTNTATYAPQQYGYIGDYMHYGCNAVYYLAQTSTGNSGYSSHMFSWYDSGHWGHYGKFVLFCQESGYIGGMAHRYLSGTSVTNVFSIGNTGSVSTSSTQTGSGTHAGQSVTRYDCTVSHTSTYRSMRWYLGVFHGCTLGVTGSGKSQSDCNTYANSNGSLLHLFGVSDSNLTMGPNYRTW